MKTTLFAFSLAITLALSGAPLTKGTFTEVINEVSVLAADTKAATPAKLQELVEAPNSVRTGARSRAELTAPDETITRVGANTVFSFTAANRTYNLDKGSLLFQSRKGKGGGTIRSGGASAAVLGTTIMIGATDTGGFKVILLEGSGQVILADGRSVLLKAGQMVFVLPNNQGFSGILDIHLGNLVAGSLLINGFSRPLPSNDLIQRAIKRQQRLIARGGATDTGQRAGRIPPGGGIDPIDPNNWQAVIPPIPAFPPPTRDPQQDPVNPQF